MVKVTPAEWVMVLLYPPVPEFMFIERQTAPESIVTAPDKSSKITSVAAVGGPALSTPEAEVADHVAAALQFPPAVLR